MNNIALDDAIKFANTAAAISLSRIGEVDAIPEIDEVLDNSGLREKFGLKSSTSTVAAPVDPQPLAPNVIVQGTEQQVMNGGVNQEYVSVPASDGQGVVNNTQESSLNIPNMNNAQAFGGQPAPVNMLETTNNNINQNTNV